MQNTYLEGLAILATKWSMLDKKDIKKISKGVYENKGHFM